VLAAVVVLGLDNLVDGLILADGFERAQLVSISDVDLGEGQPGNRDGSAAVTANGILKK
jgi:hypothetical protein